MVFGCAALSLAPAWGQDAPIVIVPSIEAIRLHRDEGYQDVPVREALWSFDTMDRRSSWQIRQFVSEARLTRFLLCDVDDRQALDIVRQAIQDGRLIALRKGDGAAQAPSATVERRRLVGQIEQLTRGKLNFSGRQYKLVADVDLSNVAGRDNYEVVSQNDALRVLDGLAKQGGTAGDLAGLLGQASAKLTPDWRPPFTQPDGLILLRRTVTRATTKSDDGPAMTPSQMRELKQGWIIIEVVYDSGGPWCGTLNLTLADGGERTIQCPDDGVVDLQNIEPGNVTVKFHL
jgi:hypothetical protein